MTDKLFFPNVPIQIIGPIFSWTESGSECAISFQALDDGQSLDRHLTKIVPFLDRHCIWTVIGQRLDRV